MTDPSPLAPRASHHDISRRQWIFLVCLFLLSLPAVTTRIYSSDEIQYFAYLRSMWFDRDLSFENEYQHFYDRGIAKSAGFHETFLERQTDTGRRINFGTVGCAILWAPFYAVGDVVARVTGAEVDGYSKPYVAAVAYGSAVYGFLALVLATLAARRLGYNAFTAAVAIWLGTPLLFYMYVAPPFSHACSAFGVALFIYVWIRVRADWSVRGFVALGAAGALMAMVREQDVFFAAGPAVDFMWSRVSAARPPAVPSAKVGGERREVRQAVVGIVAAALTFAAVFTPQAATYLVLNGHLGPHSSVGRKMNWVAPHALQVLFSPEHGFFVWTPLALIAIAGLVALFIPPEGGNYMRVKGKPGSSKVPVASALSPDELVVSALSPNDLVVSAFSPNDLVVSAFRRKRQAAVCLLLMVALQIYVGGSVESWTVAGAYGQRRFIALTAVMVIGLTALQHGLKRLAARRALMTVVALAVYWNLALIAEFSTGLMDRQRLELRKNAYDAFVTLPRQAPALIYRYLFDRSSFYKGAGGA